jgi:peptidoglycan/xylan/chitin deacetylase (PgdA/CDA1 family)
MLTSSPTRVRSLSRFSGFSLRTGRGRLILLLLALLAVALAFWINEHRTLTWKQAINPIYWYHRLRGEDLYDPQTAFLMHGNRALPEVALTFDDGPHIESRARILDILQSNHVHATFFDVGRRMDENPALVRRTLAEGNEIGNHSYWHNRLDSLSPRDRHREINDTDIAFYRITGRHLTLLRPPGMRYNPTVLADIHALGYTVVGYTTASRDFDPTETADFIVNRTLNRVENGSIILLHDYPETAVALPRIIAGLRARGYRFVTISEMLAHLPDRRRRAAERYANQIN